MTPKQAEVLEIAKTVGIKGVCIQYEWKWLRCDTGRTVNAGAIKALDRTRKIHITYYPGGNAGVTVE